ncbi:hypothetical protein [Croceibacterium ferulae]|uniref:hypothetical protein n=1 Tax=Croceibacterium ferulae TaxID=1854641 RepID=UPI000EAE41A7|nr:hypothetical protein [Croceibacterium ferulae]
MSNRRNTSRPRHKVWTPYLKLPPFLPVPLRARRDGWTPARQARFIAQLVKSACVRKAAQAIGLSRESAYRLRRHPAAGSFRAAWDTAISGKQQARWKFTQAEARDLAVDGPFHIALHRGQPCSIRRKPDDSRLLSYVTRLDRLLTHLSQTQEDDLLAWAARQPHLRRLV